jgi:hypothetical protein
MISCLICFLSCCFDYVCDLFWCCYAAFCDDIRIVSMSFFWWRSDIESPTSFFFFFSFLSIILEKKKKKKRFTYAASSNVEFLFMVMLGRTINELGMKVELNPRSLYLQTGHYASCLLHFFFLLFSLNRSFRPLGFKFFQLAISIPYSNTKILMIR